MTLEGIFTLLGMIVVLAPAVLLIILGVSSLVGWKLTEAGISRSAQVTIWMGLIAAIAVLTLMLTTGKRHVQVLDGDWVAIPHYHFAVKLMFDRLSVPFVILAFLLCGTIGAFATRYMHNEPGFNRFFVLFSMFLLGIVVAALAGTIETLFAGWELVGLSSAMLVAFYHERPAPVKNGLHVWTVYRVSDAALLLASVVLHHLNSHGDFDKLTMGEANWPYGTAALEPGWATLAGLLLVVAAAGKSALIPFSGWLPRAMEGPTPSSAVFYGALSVHLGAYLLLRVSPLLEAAPGVCAVIVVLGLSSSAVASLIMKVQTDIKSQLSFASLTQVGIIVTEIGVSGLLVHFGADVDLPLGLTLAQIGVWFRYVALLHILGHACWRTLQFLRAPTFLYDHKVLENAIGAHEVPPTRGWERWIPQASRAKFYRFALERGFLDEWLIRLVVSPVREFFEKCDRLERGVVEEVGGAPLPSSKHEKAEWSSVLQEHS